MKKSYIMIIIIIIIISACSIYYINTKKDTDKSNVSDQITVLPVLSKGDITINKLYLQKCETNISDKKSVGIRFNIDYTYISPSVLNEKNHEVKLSIVYPKELVDLLKRDSSSINITCNSDNSSKPMTINVEVYADSLSEMDVDSFINKQNSFTIGIYEGESLIEEIYIKNTMEK